MGAGKTVTTPPCLPQSVDKALAGHTNPTTDLLKFGHCCRCPRCGLLTVLWPGEWLIGGGGGEITPIGPGSYETNQVLNGLIFHPDYRPLWTFGGLWSGCRGRRQD